MIYEAGLVSMSGAWFLYLPVRPVRGQYGRCVVLTLAGAAGAWFIRTDRSSHSSDHGRKMSPVLQPYCNRVTRPYYTAVYRALGLRVWVKCGFSSVATSPFYICKIRTSAFYPRPQQLHTLPRNRPLIYRFCVVGSNTTSGTSAGLGSSFFKLISQTAGIKTNVFN